MLGYKLLTKYVLGILLVASISTNAVNAGGKSIASIQNVQGNAQAIPVGGWEQVNSNGFGDLREQEVSALETFNGYLYAGTFNVVDPLVLFDGARIFRSPDGVTWTPVTQPGFQNPHDSAPPAILDFVVFGNRIYASTGRGGNPAQIWRASTGASWAPMVTAGFGDPDIHNIPSLVVYNGAIYAGASSEVSGARIYRSSTGDSNTWTQVAPAASTMPGASVTGFAVFNGALYATVESEAPVQIWRSTNGTSWASLLNNGFGDSNTTISGGMTVFGGNLYVGTGNGVSGAQLWRTNNGTNWTQSISPGFGDPNNKQVDSVMVFQHSLYVSVKNIITGMEVWRTADGTLWEQINQDGFGDSNNTGLNRSSAAADFLSQLYVGTSNVVSGGELWRKLNPNNPPTDITLSNTTVNENQSVNTVVGNLSATDPDVGATFTFSLACAVAGADDGSFNILGKNLRTSAIFDFETKPVYNICVRVTDQGGLTFDKNFVVTVNNVNETPTSISLSNTTLAENQPIDTVVGMLGATDPDTGSTFTFRLGCAVTGADDGTFNILGINLRTSALFDYEAKSTYNICLSVTDQGGAAFDQNFIVTVTNVNEPPINISLANDMVAENQPINTLVGALSGIDPDAGATFTFSLVCGIAGADDGSFNILGTDLRTSLVFNYETKSAYNICIRVTDQGGLFFDKNFVINVSNLVENLAPTEITLSNSTVDENQPVNTIVGTLSVTDPDTGDTFTFSLSCGIAGADDGFFNIFGTDLRTSTLFDFEMKFAYSVCVRVTDQGGLSLDKNFVITVNDLAENAVPTDITLSNSTVDENQPVNKVIGALSATDPNAGDVFVFSLACAVPGADDDYFNFLGTSLRTSAMFDFETKFVYNICIRVTDQGGLSFDKNFVITVNDLAENDAPTDITLSNSAVDENKLINAVVGVLTAIDLDSGATFTFNLACAVPGTDDGSFNILGADLRTSAVFDYETKPSYAICIRVTDQGGLSFDKNFVVTVEDVDEVTNTLGKATGGGNVHLPGGKITFGFVVQYSNGALVPSGNLSFKDHSANISLKASSFTVLNISGNHAVIIGCATVNGEANVTFTLNVDDYGKPGSSDTFMIQIPALNGYSVGGTVTGGNIQISIP